MQFNSLAFAAFLPVVFAGYWLLDRLLFCKGQDSEKKVTALNAYLLLASYFFYAYWDWRFLGLLAGMSIMSYGAGVLLSFRDNETPKEYCNGAWRKAVLWMAVGANVVVLGLFKYYNFFVTSFCDLFGQDAFHSALDWVLPLGISFFTFQAIAYVVDAYRGTLISYNRKTGWTAFVDCLLYIGFFPKLLAGPIERPSHFLPQLRGRRRFDGETAIDGLHQFLWGLFKKMVVADNCAVYVNMVYADYTNQSGSTLLLAAVLYSIQIYGDFSGYSDMALGTAKLFGFSFRDNFLFPYFSRNMGEFWKRWHISLNTWFVDYVYIPLGGSRCGKVRTITNTMVIFLLSGLWHGADWSFVCWGGYHGLLLVLLILSGRNVKYPDVAAYDRRLPNLKEFGQMVGVFVLATIGWMMFRADNMEVFVGYMAGLCDRSLLTIPYLDNSLQIGLSVLLMFAVEWVTRRRSHGLAGLVTYRPAWQFIAVVVLLLVIWFMGQMEYTEFIYFQF